MEYPLIGFERDIRNSIKMYMKSQGILEEDLDLNLEIPPEGRGVYALPCFQFASLLERDPKRIAEDMSEDLELGKGYSTPEGPYLNFHIDKTYLVENTVEEAIQMEDEYGRLSPKNKKIIIEHTSANPNAPLHVGNARNPIIGDTLARIYDKAGYEVETQYYVDDMGRQVAIMTWGKENLSENEVHEPKSDKRDHLMGQYYIAANDRASEDEGVEQQISKLINQVENRDEDTIEIFSSYSKEVMKGIKASLSRLNIHHDVSKTESSLVLDGKVDSVLAELEYTKGCGFEEGAQYIEVEDKKVYLRRSDGTSLYPGRDIAYHVWKAERCDEQIDILGEDHKLHGKSISRALEMLDIEPLPKFVFYSFVTFEGEGMSTRSGKSVTLDELMDIAHEKAKEEIMKRREDFSDEKREDIAEKVGLGALRFNIIKVQNEKPIDFRWEEALDFNGDSAPFIQYTHARACSILKKFEEDGEVDLSLDEVSLNKLDEEGEISLIKKISRYPCVLEGCVKGNSPHRFAKYAYELAAEFNQFYRDYPVLKSEEKRMERTLLVKAFRNVISSALRTLGIGAPDQM